MPRSSREESTESLDKQDISKSIRIAVKTGVVVIGFESTLKAIKKGKARLVIVARNPDEDLRKQIEYYSGLSQIPVYEFKSSSWDLGSTCGKPFMISAMAIQEPGDSNIIQIAAGGRRNE
ncbi:MAG: 50S ribosomal protein L30e [Promethearchaeati archaeon SRVP18_Atabeyarchaeia-1]